MPITTCVFDAYGTLFDVAAAARTAAAEPGRDALAACWQKLVPLLEQAGVKYFLVDRAVAATPTRRAAVTWDPESEAKQIHDCIDRNIDGPVVLVGHSKGGDAVTFGGNHPQVARLVYLPAHVPGMDVPGSIVATNPKLKEGF